MPQHSIGPPVDDTRELELLRKIGALMAERERLIAALEKAAACLKAAGAPYAATQARAAIMALHI